MAANLAMTSDRFDAEVLKSDVPVLLDFWAEWCGPCKAIGPYIEQMADEYQGKAKVFKIDVDSEQDLAAKYGVVSIPMLLVMKGGQKVDQMVGAKPKPELVKFLERNL